MSETTRIVVPLTGANVTPASVETPAQPERETGFVNGQYVPPAKRVSLHNVRMPIAKQTEAPAPQPSQTDAISQQLSMLQTAVNTLAASQIANMQRGQVAPDRELGPLDKLRLHNQYGSGPYAEDSDSQPQYGGPDPTRFDFYDELDTQDFLRLNNHHIEQTVQQRLEAERAAQQKTAQDNALNEEFDAVRTRYGRDRNFAEVAERAILECAQAYAAKQPFSVTETYKRISDEIESRDGKRRSTFLPENIKTLGEIERYRRETGRIK